VDRIVQIHVDRKIRVDAHGNGFHHREVHQH
jgi:hypothetical protein